MKKQACRKCKELWRARMDIFGFWKKRTKKSPAEAGLVKEAEV